MQLEVSKKSFGVINLFESYEINLVKRNKFIKVPEKLKINQFPSKTTSILNSTPIKLSNFFFDENLIGRPLSDEERRTAPFLTEENYVENFDPHHYSIEFLYNNLQRLCMEVLDPVTELNGKRPFIENALLFRSNLSGVDMDSFFADQLQGNAVVLNFKNDEDNVLFDRSLQFITEFSLFDRLLVDKTLKKYERPTLMISVNEKKRGIIGRVGRD